jgi:carbon monoxide dehydrogenase subunit G
MIISGELTVEAPRETVFDRLQDARRFVSLVEGVQDLTEIDPTHYNAVLETKIAYMRFKFKVAVEVTRSERPNLIEAKIEGSPLGVVGRLSATTVTTLSEVAGNTQVSYSVDAAITGKLGSMGQPLLRSKAKEMETQFAKNLRAMFAEEAKGAVS